MATHNCAGVKLWAFGFAMYLCSHFGLASSCQGKYAYDKIRGERGRRGKRGYLPRASRYNWGLAVIELGDHTCSVASSRIIGLSQRPPPAHMHAS